ncbi:MAG: IS66 family insertion sequence element accessory protein TnpB [Polyangiales bacterium]
MIPHGVEIFVSLDPIDMRLGFDRLAGLVEATMGRSPRSEALFLFFGKRRTSLKILFFDGTGLCIFYKRLDKGTFRLPAAEGDAKVIELEERALDALLDGIDVESARSEKAQGAKRRVH